MGYLQIWLENLFWELDPSVFVPLDGLSHLWRLNLETGIVSGYPDDESEVGSRFVVDCDVSGGQLDNVYVLEQVVDDLLVWLLLEHSKYQSVDPAVQNVALFFLVK